MKEAFVVPSYGVDITDLFIKNVSKSINIDNNEASLFKFSQFVRYIMHNPREISMNNMVDGREYKTWTAGRKYHSKNGTFVEDYEQDSQDIHKTLIMYKNYDVFVNFFEYMLKLTKERALRISREDLNLYKDYRRSQFNGDPDSAFAHSVSYIHIGDTYLIIDFMDIELFINEANTCGAYTITSCRKK